MNKLFTLVLATCLSLFATIANADNTYTFTEGNYLTVKVLPTTDIHRIPVEVSMTNQLPITAIEFYLTLPENKNTFLYDEEDESYVFEKSSRWRSTHGATITWGTAVKKNSLWVSVVSSTTQNFKLNEGPLMTFYFDGSYITDGKYDVTLEDPLLIWSDKTSTDTYVSPDTTQAFTVEDNKVYPGDTVKACVVTYIVDNDTLSSEKLPVGVELVAPTVPAKTGYTFSGWGNLPATATVDTTFTGTYNINKYVISYTLDGESFKKDTLDYNTTITPPEAPAKTGYTFNGWGEVAQKATANVTYNGTYSVNKYAVSFVIDGNEFKKDTLDYNAPITVPEAPSKTGYTFSGWGSVAEKMPANDTTYTGTYLINQYTVSFVIEDKEIKKDTLNYNSAITTPEAPAKTGYTFSGWGEVATTVPASNVVYKGSYTINKYAVSFYIDDTLFKTDTLNYNSEITTPEAPEKTGYTFSGWGEVANTVPANNVEYKGTYDINKYAVSFYVDDILFKTDTLNYNSAITTPEAPEKTGYTFSGWGEVASSVPANNVEYKGTYDINKYAVSFYVDGKLFKTDTLNYASEITIPTSPTKEGSTFSGWKDVAETVPANDVSYYATFSTDKYTVTFIAEGDTIKSENLDFGTAIIVPDAPAKEGYTFVTWGDVATTVPAANITYTATYEINKYVITYYVDDEVYATDTLAYGATIVPPIDPSKEDYFFTGWGEMESTMPASNLQYTASFQRLGDVNLDGNVNGADVVAVYNYITNKDASGVIRDNADINIDGSINGADVVDIYNYITYGTKFKSRKWKGFNN